MQFQSPQHVRYNRLEAVLSYMLRGSEQTTLLASGIANRRHVRRCLSCTEEQPRWGRECLVFEKQSFAQHLATRDRFQSPQHVYQKYRPYWSVFLVRVAAATQKQPRSLRGCRDTSHYVDVYLSTQSSTHTFAISDCMYITRARYSSSAPSRYQLRLYHTSRYIAPPLA